MNNTYGKGMVISASREIRKSQEGVGPVWRVESETREGKFYRVEYVNETGELTCECPAFVMNVTVPCKHALAVARLEVSK
jgi:uncharacterized Zn finger protein